MKGDNYIIVSEQTMNINSFPDNVTSVTGCSAGIPDRAYDASGELDVKGVLSKIVGINIVYKRPGRENCEIVYSSSFRASVGEAVNETRIHTKLYLKLIL
ncbi:hypothetical protein O9H85_23535 [Paenibacillus filicis]|uniref:Uncharacterized protein n=1 Tax=Paenibacillus gyeongsangnamensis TaxID=3388067 RepID=A0ABT4QEM3_9BACL|nr:hypothetical protein [Paenibacillus filicis]MCZ8515328.1 hypothetical protein [Paenibacillus filicis]